MRCFWVNLKNQRYVEYHDREWGVPLHDDIKLFELLILECFQSGLSWECVLNKRDSFREAFEGFVPEKVASFSEEKCQQLRENSNIIRNRLKIKAAVTNAKVFLAIQEQFGSFDRYLWSFTGNKVIIEPCDRCTTSALSDAVSEDLKKRGMAFAGSTVVYSFLQASGVINGHTNECSLSPLKTGKENHG
ncbi:MAG: DNA-3-methyladenine glycosylase I [Lentisphaeria bacterium]|nr:DNA-3-methyladenine glycosylase I [Lentisphaeria bacterium]